MPPPHPEICINEQRRKEFNEWGTKQIDQNDKTGKAQAREKTNPQHVDDFNTTPLKYNLPMFNKCTFQGVNSNQ